MAQAAQAWWLASLRPLPWSLRLAGMGGHFRLWHPKWWSRYLWGGIASINLFGFVADMQYGINRSKNPEIMWPWWHEIMRKKEEGVIPKDMPGYMLCKFRNEPEERWTAENEEKFGEFMGVLDEE
uniref:Uncharacterized protein n=1 Tax=Alexandrium monilatum TaxID=311494 RepID=A0A7S4RYK5_9DINO